MPPPWSPDTRAAPSRSSRSTARSHWLPCARPRGGPPPPPRRAVEELNPTWVSIAPLRNVNYPNVKA